MQETPPHTLLEIRLLLSQYLDEVLEPAQMQEIDGLLSRFPQYVEELRNLKKSREALLSSLDGQELPKTPDDQANKDAWRSISKRLKADKKNETRSFDAEFVSAYYDGEIPAVDSEFIEFESQLFHNVEANDLLARMGEISESVRQFGYRLENACTLDIAQDVMAAFRAEQPQASIDIKVLDAGSWEDPVPAELELMSAYADQALTPRETIEANRLIESGQTAKFALGRFNRISERIASISTQIQAQAPDLWPSVLVMLNKPPEEGGLVVPIDRFRTLRRWAKIAGPVAAAVLLLVLFTPAQQQQQAPVQSIAQVIPVSQPQADMLSSDLNGQPAAQETLASEYRELASVPGRSGQQPVGLTFVSASAEETSVRPNDVIPALEVRRSYGLTARPAVAAPSPAKVAARPVAKAESEGKMISSGKSSPSSEEYLFNALNEQMPGEDLSSIFGK